MLHAHHNESSDAELALAFVNTGRSARFADDLATPQGTARWIAEHVLAGASAFELSPPEARRLHSEAHRLREAMDTLFEVTAAGLLPSDATLATLERALRAASWRRRIEFSGLRVGWSAYPEPSRDPLAALSPVASAALGVAGAVDPTRIRRCAAHDCSRWFVDTSRGGRRRWCSMETCGNRAKAARYRERHPAGA
jgi:predicted RNA-binding Zn ribbon-like protein